MNKKGRFSSIISSDIPVLVDFHATWCGPCKAMSPVISELASAYKGKAKMIKIDVDKNRTIAERYQISGVPTFMLFVKGNIVWRQSGMISKHQITQILEQHISNSSHYA